MNGYADGYVRDLKALEKALSELKEKKKQLESAKKRKEAQLYQYMERTGIQEYKGIKKKKIQPKERTKRKPESQKRNDAIRLFREIGVPNAEGFYNEFRKTQRYSQLQ
jgi:hypothetical protein